MARVTVEDCIEVIPNRFDLVVKAAARSRALSGGASMTVPMDNDKNPVVALREIAARTIDINDLHEGILRKLQHVGFAEESLSFDDEMSSDDNMSDVLLGDDAADDMDESDDDISEETEAPLAHS